MTDTQITVSSEHTLKLICAVVFGLFVSAAQAADDAPAVTYGKQIAASIASGACAAVTQPTSKVEPDGTTSEIYDASTEELHRCQYMREMSDSGCVSTGSCSNYEDWTRANPAISPSLPREAFLSAISARNTAAHSQDN